MLDSRSGVLLWPERVACVITAELLVAAVGCSKADGAKWAGVLMQACAAHNITTPARVAAFLAQIGHESGSLRYVREIASGEAYEGRKDLGNTEPGDGPRFRGRGLIQITGRANYRATTKRLAWANPPDFEDFPEALEEPFWAAYSAADYWQANTLSTLADNGEFVAIGRAINRGNRYSDKPANGEADRLARWERAKAAIAAADQAPVKHPSSNSPPITSFPAGEAGAPEQPMPLPAIVGALLPTLIESIPKLGKLFGSGSAVAERNVKAAELAMTIAKDAVGAVNAQEAIEKIKADPAAAATAAAAIEARWLELSEAGGGGIAAARKADGETAARGDMLHSPSFWIGLLLLPLVYLFTLSLIGIIGSATWSDDVRAGLAGSIISAIIGGLIGFYFGQTTTRNRTPAP